MNTLALKRVPFIFIIDFEMHEPFVFTLEEALANKILFDVDGFKNYSIQPKYEKKISFKKFPVEYSTYLAAFNKVLDNIKNGNTYLLNLTLPTKIETNLTLEEIFYMGRAKYKLFVPERFVVFSPETFVRITNNRIYSFPMKGTIDASVENAREKILNDEKELAEHTTIVDLIRNDLSIAAKNVTVEKFRYVEEIATHEKKLLQVSSKIGGELPGNYLERLGEIIFDILPAGSISGAPKKKTVEIIKEAEGYKRGYYTGVFGYFDGQSLESAVMIRFIERIGDDLFYKSGGGITAMSDPLSEYNELIDKVYVPII
ncbi:MAG: aminodeoxychorismate synthase component I [Ignavibacteriales bacterium]|nr:aminodeoxychorismate synthase component I [Ignavibacteriales bacterium]